MRFLPQALTTDTVSLSVGCRAVCVFVNDKLSRPVLQALAHLGIRLVALRCTGYNQVDIGAARELGT